jgi:hypothetical protein
MFLVRTPAINFYEAYLKRQMDGLNKEEILSSSKFKKILEE